MKSQIAETDARFIIRLLADAAILPDGHLEKKRFLMNGLCTLIGANSWVWTLACQVKPGEDQVYVGFLHGGFDEQRFADLLTAVEHPEMPVAVERFYIALEQSQSHTTMLLEEIDPELHSVTSAVSEYWIKADIGPTMLSGYPLDSQSVSTIGLYRSYEASAFSQREKQIAHLILNEVPWLHSAGWPEDRGSSVPKLQSKQRIVLNLLLEGSPRKDIADQMKISENTVSRYAADVYRHFGVNSHPELMQKFLLPNSL